MKGRWLGIGLVFFFVMVKLGVAETKIFVEEYTYQASEADSKISSRIIALEQVKRKLLENLGTYLESETEVKNFQLTKDQIVILTAGIVRAEILDEKWDGKTYYLKAKMTADPKDLANSIDKLRQDRQKTKELEETRKKADEALREVERLKKELETGKAEEPNLRRYNKAVNGLSAIDWFEKGNALVKTDKHQDAREAFTKAIELDPKYAMAYSGRGFAYAQLGDHRQAKRDFDKAIELDPKSALVYGMRGFFYLKLRDYQQAIRDFNKAIELSPYFAEAYSGRGIAYAQLGDHREAIRDLDRAIELDPKSALVYGMRGVAYAKLGDHREAIRDFNKAIQITPNSARAYSNRGYVYIDLENLQFAERDLKKALELYASSDRRMDSYIGLAIVYFRKGEKEEAKNYYQEAIKIDSSCKGGVEVLEKERGYFYSPRQKKTISEILSLFPSK